MSKADSDMDLGGSIPNDNGGWVGESSYLNVVPNR